MLWIFPLGIFGLLFLAGGTALGVHAWHILQKASQFSCPRSRINKLKPGYRKIRGKLAAVGEPLCGPVSQKECVYYRLRVYEDKTTYHGKPELPGGEFMAFFWFGLLGFYLYRIYDLGVSDTRASHSRRFLVDEEFDVLPRVEDDTGGVEVDLRGASVVTKDKVRIASGDNNPPPSALERLLREEYDFDTVDQRGTFKRLQFIEEFLPVGAKVTVIGPVEQLKSGDLRFQKTDGPLFVSEPSPEKETQTMRSRAIGCAFGSGGALAAGLGYILGAIVLVVRGLLGH